MFTFHTDTIDEYKSIGTNVINAVPIKKTNGNWILLTEQNEVLLLERSSKKISKILTIEPEQAPNSGHSQLVLSDDGTFLAITRRKRDDVSSYNWGSIYNLDTKMKVKELSWGDYHTCHTDFPVAFLTKENRTLIVHATDWDILHVTDLTSGECLTSRDTDSPSNLTDVEMDRCTEWPGPLVISPNQEKIASIGWMWHPVGVAYSWNLNDWLEQNPWEADYGESKRIFYQWPYFWGQPFAWIDNTRLCIWGYEKAPLDENKNPTPSAAIYDTDSGELTHWFPGPTIDIFYVDQYLFSGSEDRKSLSIWDLDSGKLLHSEKWFEARLVYYHHENKEFLSIAKDGSFIFTSWKN